jgi:ribosomal protein L37AE/L43A
MNSEPVCARCEGTPAMYRESMGFYVCEACHDIATGAYRESLQREDTK